jgi:hypothetical protein
MNMLPMASVTILMIMRVRQNPLRVGMSA